MKQRLHLFLLSSSCGRSPRVLDSPLQVQTTVGHTDLERAAAKPPYQQRGPYSRMRQQPLQGGSGTISEIPT